MQRNRKLRRWIDIDSSMNIQDIFDFVFLCLIFEHYILHISLSGSPSLQRKLYSMNTNKFRLSSIGPSAEPA